MPEARDVMREWIKANVPEALGEFIAQVPGEIVGPCACDDVPIATSAKMEMSAV